MDPVPSPRDDIEEILVTEAQLEEAVARLAERLTADVGISGRCLGVLTGAFVFLADLIRRLDFRWRSSSSARAVTTRAPKPPNCR